jgi:hypothetical protein
VILNITRNQDIGAGTCRRQCPGYG